MHGVRGFVMVVLSVSLGAAGVGCGLMRRRGAPADDRFVEDMRHGRRPMGQVVVVELDKGFVLVQSPLASVTSPEATLVVKAQGTAVTTGTVKVTPERKKNRIAADIVEGTPKIGDVVFYRSEEKVVSTAPPPSDPGQGAMTGGERPGTSVAAGVMSRMGEPGSVPEVTGLEAGAVGDLPPLGEPSGPREVVPDFPGLDPLPPPVGGPGALEEIPEPADPAA